MLLYGVWCACRSVSFMLFSCSVCPLFLCSCIFVRYFFFFVYAMLCYRRVRVVIFVRRHVCRFHFVSFGYVMVCDDIVFSFLFSFLLFSVVSFCFHVCVCRVCMCVVLYCFVMTCIIVSCRVIVCRVVECLALTGSVLPWRVVSCRVVSLCFVHVRIFPFIFFSFLLCYAIVVPVRCFYVFFVTCQVVRCVSCVFVSFRIIPV